MVHWHPLRAPTLSIITHPLLRATVTVTAIGHGMDAHPVTRCRVETAHPTKAQLVADGVLITAAHPVTHRRLHALA